MHKCLFTINVSIKNKIDLSFEKTKTNPKHNPFSNETSCYVIVIGFHLFIYFPFVSETFIVVGIKLFSFSYK